MRGRVIDVEAVPVNEIPSDALRGLGQASGGYTYYTPNGTSVSVNLPGPAGGWQGSLYTWLEQDTLLAGIANKWLFGSAIAIWLFMRRH